MKYLHLCLGMGILFAQALSAGAAEEPKAALEELPALSLDDFGWIERDILGEIESGLDRTIPRVKRLRPPTLKSPLNTETGENRDKIIAG